MKQIIIIEDSIALRFTQRKDDPFKWDMAHQNAQGAWIDLIGTGGVDGRDLLWQCAATIGVGTVAAES